MRCAISSMDRYGYKAMGIPTKLDWQIIFSWEEVTKEAVSRCHLSSNVKNVSEEQGSRKRKGISCGWNYQERNEWENGKYVQGPVSSLVLFKCKKRRSVNLLKVATQARQHWMTMGAWAWSLSHFSWQLSHQKENGGFRPKTKQN